jgi:hypothetical protein
MIVGRGGYPKLGQGLRQKCATVCVAVVAS